MENKDISQYEKEHPTIIDHYMGYTVIMKFIGDKTLQQCMENIARLHINGKK